jgi:glycosyltransferase involved in cell wall biosynthesis/GT2 family glycosyltransferase
MDNVVLTQKWEIAIHRIRKELDNLESFLPPVKIPICVSDAIPKDEILAMQVPEVPGKITTIRQTLKAVWCGMGGTQYLATDILGPVLKEQGYDLITISEWDSASVKWTRDTWAKEMLRADICICPQPEGVRDAKSNVKVTTAMALGLPVIASPIPAYRELIRHGENGYLASIYHMDQWAKALEALRDPEVRKRIGAAGRETAKAYSMDVIAGGWARLLEEVAHSSPAKQAAPPAITSPGEPVDLIIATYQNLPYIKHLINSIWMNTDTPYRIVISDAGSGPKVWEYLRSLQGIVLLGRPDQRLNYSEAINAGVAAGNSKYFVVMNSDLVVSRGWLRALVAAMDREDRLAACGNLSNCNIDWTLPANAITPIQSKGQVLTLRAGMKLHEYEPHLEALQGFMAASNAQHRGVFHEREWVAAYCTIYARAAWNEVGGFDPIYQNGCEDLDHCIRLRRAGYRIGEAYDAFIFHAGGVSRGAYEAEGREKYQAENERNHIICKTKWAQKKIAIWTGPGWEKWDAKKVQAGMGGSETWAAELAAEFARRGFQVLVFGDPAEAHMAGDVAYHPWQEMEEVLAYDWADVLICSRSVEPLKLKNLHVGQVYVMIHDVWLSQDGRAIDATDWRVKKYAYLSEWHRDFLLQHHPGMKREKMFLTMNGVNQKLYEQPPEVGSTYDVHLLDGRQLHSHIVKRNQTVYSSSPDRGLLQLLRILPEIRKAVPDFVVKVAYGWENIDKAIARGDKRLAEVKAAIRPLLQQPGVEWLGRIDKGTLARHQMESKVWLYPTWFSETFCITAVENGLARNAIVTSDHAGMRRTVDDHGILIPWSEPQGYTGAYLRRFIDEAITLLTNEAHRQNWANLAYHHAKHYTWAAAANGWLREFGWA